MNENKISFLQTACLLIICRVTVMLTHTPVFSFKSYTSADLTAVAFALPVILVEYIPVFLLARRKSSVISLAYEAAVPFGHVISVLYALFFAGVAALSASRFDTFITTCVFPKSSAAGFILLIVLFAGISSVRGLEGIARASTLLIIFILGAVILFFIAPVKLYDTTNFISPLIYGGEKIFSSAMTIISHSAEAAMLSVLVLNVRDKIFKSYLIFSLVSAAAIAIMMATVILVVGDYSSLVFFPYYTAASVTTVSSFSSLSPILIGIWIMGVYLKCTFCIFLCTLCLGKILKKTWISAVVSSVLIFAAAYTLSRGMNLYKIIFSPEVSLAACLIFTFVLPFSVLLAGGKKHEKA